MTQNQLTLAPKLSQSESSELSRPARIGVSAFLMFNLFAIVTWCMPLDSPLIARCRSLIRPYLLYTGLFQKWDMFAPRSIQSESLCGGRGYISGWVNVGLDVSADGKPRLYRQVLQRAVP